MRPSISTSEFSGFLIHHVRNARTRDHEDFGCVRLRQLALLDPDGQLLHQLLLQQAPVVDLFSRRAMQTPGLVLRKAQLQENVRARLCHMANFGIDLHLESFLEAMIHVDSLLAP